MPRTYPLLKFVRLDELTAMGGENDGLVFYRLECKNGQPEPLSYFFQLEDLTNLLNATINFLSSDELVEAESVARSPTCDGACECADDGDEPELVGQIASLIRAEEGKGPGGEPHVLLWFKVGEAPDEMESYAICRDDFLRIFVSCLRLLAPLGFTIAKREGDSAA